MMIDPEVLLKRFIFGALFGVGGIVLVPKLVTRTAVMEVQYIPGMKLTNYQSTLSALERSTFLLRDLEVEDEKEFI